MLSVKSTVFALATAFVAVANADYVIDPKSVSLSIRQGWCKSEKSICPAICQEISDGTTKVNDCTPETLTYGCICGDGKQPNVSEYSLSLPYFVCQEWGNQCVKQCNGNNACSSSCREDNPCGATNPKKYTTTLSAEPTTGAAQATQTQKEEDVIHSGDVIASNPDTSKTSKSSSDKSDAVSAIEVGRLWGLPVVLGSMFVGFALL